MSDLTVIIVSFNSARWLAPCLASIYEHAGDARLDVLVVDNNSADGSPELVEHRFPQVRVLRSENRGFARANNLGLKATDAPYVLFLNPDTNVREGTLGDLLRLLSKQPSVGILGCRQMSGEGSLLPTIRRFPSATRQLLEALGSEHFPIRAGWMGERELDPGAYSDSVQCDWVTGSFMLARREAVLAAGLMDERYFLYREETDLCLAVKNAGWTVLYTPEMTITHHCTSSSSARLEAQEAYARRQYLFKHHGHARRSLSTLALALFYARRAVYVSAAHSQAATRRRAARVALRTVLGTAPPPFGELSGSLRGPRS
jgi:GT2 family glycosyltransferase